LNWYYRNLITLSVLAIVLAALPLGPIRAQDGDSLIAVDIGLMPGDTGHVSIYLRNTQFLVSGFTIRLELEDTNYVNITGVERGQDVLDFEYFYSANSNSFCKVTAVVNWPGWGDPPPLEIGVHEVARVGISVASNAPVGFSDSLYFRSDTLPPDRDNSISDNSGYINVVPVLRGGRILIVSPTGVDNEPGKLPESVSLTQNYPNPFNAQTQLSFELSTDCSGVSLVIFDILGRNIKRFQWDSLPSGRHTVTWYGRDDGENPMASGVYFYRLTGSDFETALMKMTLLK